MLLPKEGSDEWKELEAEGLKLKKQCQGGESAVLLTPIKYLPLVKTLQASRKSMLIKANFSGLHGVCQ